MTTEIQNILDYAKYDDAIKLYYDAKTAYETTDKTLLTDEDYDVLEHYLISNNLIEFQAGVSDDIFASYDGVKRPQKYPMLSIETIKQKQIDTKEKFDNHFINKYSDTANGVYAADTCIYDVTSKYDGVAIQIVIENCKPQYAITRGDRTQGFDVSNRLAHVMSQLEIKNDKIVAVIGEAVISKQNFKEHFGHYKNERNAVAGLINSTKNKANQELCKYIDFIAFKYVYKNGEVGAVQDIFFDSTQNVKCANSRAAKFNELYEIATDELAAIDKNVYRCDGVVILCTDQDIKAVKNGYYYAYTAFKNVADEETFKIVDIEFRPRNNGSLFPVAILDGKELDGSFVKRVSVFNYGTMIEKGLFPGAIIKLSKSGDIIPHIQEVIEPAYETQEFRDKHGFDESNTTFNGTDIFFDGVNIEKKKFINAVVCAGFDNVGYAIAKDLYEAGYTSILQLFEYDPKRLAHKYALGSITANNIAKQIETKLINCKLSKLVFLMRFNGIGGVSAKRLAKHIKSILCGNGDAIAKFNKYEREVLRSHEYQHFINFVKTNTHRVVMDEDEVAQNVSFDKLAVKICMTGSPKQFGWKTKAEFIKALEEKDELVHYQEVSVKDAVFLITDDVNSNSSKTKEAKKHNTAIITYADFYYDSKR